ncbi:glutathione-dependent formaldehyde dehydrogenase [Hymenobacter busanensis]|uniref:Glutathione-dependent formaldehyde dehydrogenase n=1 Tax=Hymenobacter busanensis TaxID=2607656 RepID=A0A7L5A0K6_9BACT|nr:zinc-dependent alcohol dehydrogenase [Hymenobacter busanensis]KAA9338514.1 glutathione-dependent formaldehyde dehydrogenase [Hymenobacter busanensis]QHJ09058.1 alcohol dehydrogenase catalytic domain-containing protein [Hymenobacter busanensis]
MKALVFHGIKDVRVDTVDDPKIEDARDAIIRVTSTAICGSDLHIYNGGIPQPRPMVLGHEFMGIVEEVGKGVGGKLKVGDRVVVPFPIACGTCFFCNRDLPGHCEHSNPDHYGPEGGVLTEKGGALFGYTDLYGGYNGGQAEYVRVPYADYGPRVIPDSLTDEQALFLTDIFPTGYSGIDWGEVKGGEFVAIFGAGPVGIMAAKSAWLRGAGRVVIVDVLQYRLDKARATANVETILWEDRKQVIEEIRALTGGRGADVCVEAVGFEPERDLLDRAKAVINFEKGSPKVLEACMSAVRRGGNVSVLGVYGAYFDNFPLGQFFDKGITLRGGQAPAHKHIDTLLQYVIDGKVQLDDVISHRLPLAEAAHGYDIFRNKKDNCTKVVLKP